MIVMLKLGSRCMMHNSHIQFGVHKSTVNRNRRSIPRPVARECIPIRPTVIRAQYWSNASFGSRAPPGIEDHWAKNIDYTIN